MLENVQQSEQTPALPAGESAPWRFAETVAGSLLSPGRTLREVGQREAIVPAMLLVLLLAVVGASGQLAALAGSIGETQAVAAAGSLVAFQLTSILWNVVWTPVAWTIAAALLFGAAYLLGGRGRFQALWAASGFALTPQILAAPLAPVMQLAGMLGPGWQILALFVSIPVYLFVFVWTLVLLSIAVRETMNVSGGRAFGAVALLIGGFVLLAILAMCLLVLLVVGLIAAVA